MVMIGTLLLMMVLLTVGVVALVLWLIRRA